MASGRKDLSLQALPSLSGDPQPTQGTESVVTESQIREAHTMRAGEKREQKVA